MEVVLVPISTGKCSRGLSTTAPLRSTVEIYKNRARNVSSRGAKDSESNVALMWRQIEKLIPIRFPLCFAFRCNPLIIKEVLEEGLEP